MHRCHLELKKNSLTYFVRLLHKHGVRWTEKDVLKIVPVREGAESSLEWKEGSAAGRLPAEPSWSGRGKHNVLEASERQQEEKYSTSAPDFKEKKKQKLLLSLINIQLDLNTLSQLLGFISRIKIKG